MSWNLIGTYEGLPFYSDVLVTDEEVQSLWIYGIRSAIDSLTTLGGTPAKTVMREGKILAFPELEEDDPNVW